jgi:hypothetical protein
LDTDPLKQAFLALLAEGRRRMGSDGFEMLVHQWLLED